MDRPEFKDKQQVEAPFNHYLEIYKSDSPEEIEKRTGLVFTDNSFSLTLVGTEYDINHPDFSMVEKTSGTILRNPYEEILIIHYLTEGVFEQATEKTIDYRGFRGGNLYYSNFKQRSIDRIARMFGSRPESLIEAVNRIPRLRKIQISGCDAGVRIEFIQNLWVTVMVWAGDEEFPANAQVLFSDNFPKAFTAEDAAGICDILIARIKKFL